MRMVTSAVSLGEVPSLAEIPPLPAPQHMRDAGMVSSLGLVRLSIGLEHAGDLVAEIQQALAAA